ncbi:Phosphoethanolamine transferase CptA [Thalassocella blandensis]|nr:Phosphoethanolamine transferase CptA [Thalassocella blandensis]
MYKLLEFRNDDVSLKGVLIGLLFSFLLFLWMYFLLSWEDASWLRVMSVPFMLFWVYLYSLQNHSIPNFFSSSIVLILYFWIDYASFYKSYAYVQIAYFVLALCLYVFLSIIDFLFAGCTLIWRCFLKGIFLYLFAFLPICFLAHVEFLGTPVAKDSIYALLQTNFKEASEFLAFYLNGVGILKILLLFLLLLLPLAMEKKHCPSKPKIVNLVLASVLLMLCCYKVGERARIFSLTVASFNEYKMEVAAFEEIQNALSKEQPFLSSTDAHGEIHLLIVGESLNKNHMGVYGYFRDTTPELSDLRDELIFYENAYSNHTHTMQSLSFALTNVNQYSGGDFFKSVSLINVLKKAGVNTKWITNQSMYGTWDHLVTIIAKQADELVTKNTSIGESFDTRVFDGSLLADLKAIPSPKEEENIFVVAHLMGSHVDYCERFPSDFKVYDGMVSLSEFGSFSRNYGAVKKLNCYDSSVRYNDHVVAQMIKQLKSLDLVSSVTYFADHSESVFDGKGHQSGAFEFEMAEIPLVFWVSEKYKERYPGKYTSLKQNKNKLFTNDLIFDTVLGIQSITTSLIEAAFDLTSEEFHLESEKAKVLHGKVPFLDTQNTSYFKRENAAHFNEKLSQPRILPHRVNTLGKLRDVVNSGLSGVEIDVVLTDEGDVCGQEITCLQVGHDLHSLSGISLDEFLSDAAFKGVRKIWLDVKNLDKGNAKTIFDQIDSLHEKYSLKNRVIFETSFVGDEVFRFTQSGWHTSYYLPTTAVLQANVSESSELADGILEVIASQKFSAISFDVRLYDFVSSYLVRKLSDEIEFHVWDLNLSLGDKSLQQSFKAKGYYQDKRVKTILIPYKSHFDI